MSSLLTPIFFAKNIHIQHSRENLSRIACSGVVNQPFVTKGERGAAHWSINLNKIKISSIEGKECSRKGPRVLIGSSENDKILSCLAKECDVIKAGGAGHKLMMVALGNNKSLY